MARGLTTGHIVGGTLVLGWIGFQVFQGLTKGRIYTKRGLLERDQSPVVFWIVMALYGFVLVFGVIGFGQAAGWIPRF